MNELSGELAQVVEHLNQFGRAAAKAGNYNLEAEAVCAMITLSLIADPRAIMTRDPDTGAPLWTMRKPS